MSHSRNSFIVLLLCAVSAFGAGFRDGGKYCPHGRFTNPKNMWLYSSFNEGHVQTARNWTHHSDDVHLNNIPSGHDGDGSSGHAYVGDGSAPASPPTYEYASDASDSRGWFQGTRITIGLAFKNDTAPNGSYSRIWVAAQYLSGYKYRLLVIYQNNPGVMLSLRGRDSAAQLQNFGDVSYPLNEEVHVGYTFDDASKAYVGYSNTTTIASGTWSAFAGWASGQPVRSVISAASVDGYIVNGYLDEFFVCDDIWTPQQFALWVTRGKH